jgi:hypothetical protein
MLVSRAKCVWELYTRSALTLCDQVLSAWLVDQAPLGHKSPRPGHVRQLSCPVCYAVNFSVVKLSCFHLLAECQAMRTTRASLGIETFFAEARSASRGRMPAIL